MNKKWVGRFQYVYRLSLLALYNNEEDFQDELSHPSFREIYDYDLERVGLTEAIRNRVYEMPVYIFMILLTYAVLYNDDEIFDGVYKILKYKVMVDGNGSFKTISKTDNILSSNYIYILSQILGSRNKKQYFIKKFLA